MELGDQAKIADYLNAIRRLAAVVGRGEYEHAVPAARAGLGDKAFTAAWNAGETLLPEHAVDEALALTATPVSGAVRLTP